jgi:hypothetical protein
MKKPMIVPAYLWAAICVLLIPVTFIGNDGLARQMARLPFMKINPVYSGGELQRTIEKEGLIIAINNPVFVALIGESRRGFVQIRFAGRPQLPAAIQEAIDYNGDSTPDFHVDINTVSGVTTLDPLSKDVLSLNASSRVNEDWVIRVNLHNPKK